MRRESPETLGEHGPAAIRVGWWISFLATLLLILGFGVAKSAQAVTLPGASGAIPSIFIPDPEEEAEEEEDEASWEDEECEVSEDEEEVECEEEELEEATPPECLLSSAVATVSASPARDTVRLSIRYTARSSAAVKVGFRLRGNRGALRLGAGQERFKRAGVFRQTERLSAAQMKKVIAAKDFTVELAALNTPRYCHRYFDRHLTVKRASGAALTWSEPAARKNSGV